MIARVIAASAIALGGTLAFATTAKAQTVDVPFNGTVVFQCAFGPVTPGVLVPVGTPATALSSLAPGGASGLTSILCNSDADIDVTGVNKVAGAPFTEFDVNATVNGTPALPVTAGVDTALSVDLEVISTDLIPPGDYTYVVTLTAVP